MRSWGPAVAAAPWLDLFFDCEGRGHRGAASAGAAAAASSKITGGLGVGAGEASLLSSKMRKPPGVGYRRHRRVLEDHGRRLRSLGVEAGRERRRSRPLHPQNADWYGVRFVGDAARVVVEDGEAGRAGGRRLVEDRRTAEPVPRRGAARAPASPSPSRPHPPIAAASAAPLVQRAPADYSTSGVSFFSRTRAAASPAAPSALHSSPARARTARRPPQISSPSRPRRPARPRPARGSLPLDAAPSRRRRRRGRGSRRPARARRGRSARLPYNARPANASTQRWRRRCLSAPARPRFIRRAAGVAGHFLLLLGCSALQRRFGLRLVRPRVAAVRFRGTECSGRCCVVLSRWAGDFGPLCG